MKYDKMIRTKIPYIISNEGKISEIVMIDKDSPEANQYIAKKLLEEAEEVFGARGSVNDALEELGDLYEVMLTMCDSLGVQMSDVIEAAENKAVTRGKFIDNQGKIPILKSVD
jgi:predicted house-cleaning noncanonical NTP pyrophosphatase (MazG superfamily)